MTKQQRLCGLAITFVAFCSSGAWASQPRFTGLGDLPGGYFQSTPLAVSADGSIVVGNSVSEASQPNREAFRWENDVLESLGDFPGGRLFSDAQGISANGAVVVGYGETENGFEAARWEDGEMVGLGDLPTGSQSSTAYAVSADGSVVVGSSSVYVGGYTGEAFRWEDGIMTGLGDLPGGDFSSGAYSVSADGSIVVGASDSSHGSEAFRWEEGSMVGLGGLSGWTDSAAADVSANGAVVVGTCDLNNFTSRAFRWEDGVMTDLGPSAQVSRARAVSADGTVIVGETPQGAIIWDDLHGTRQIEDVLTGLGLDLTGWNLLGAYDVSADGLTVVGTALNPDGGYEGWIAHLPEPGTIVLVVLGSVLCGRRRR